MAWVLAVETAAAAVDMVAAAVAGPVIAIAEEAPLKAQPN